jgi:hypothetical protein
MLRRVAPSLVDQIAVRPDDDVRRGPRQVVLRRARSRWGGDAAVNRRDRAGLRRFFEPNRRLKAGPSRNWWIPSQRAGAGDRNRVQQAAGRQRCYLAPHESARHRPEPTPATAPVRSTGPPSNAPQTLRAQQTAGRPESGHRPHATSRPVVTAPLRPAPSQAFRTAAVAPKHRADAPAVPVQRRHDPGRYPVPPSEKHPPSPAHHHVDEVSETAANT